jgi:periplasmic protein TonB
MTSQRTSPSTMSPFEPGQPPGQPMPSGSASPLPPSGEPPRADTGSSIRPDGPIFGRYQIQQNRRLGGALGVSIATHAVAILIIMLIVSMAPLPSVAPLREAFMPAEIIWTAEPGPGGGGGGGGNQMKEPPRKAELPGKEKITVPVVKPPSLEPPPKVEKPPEPKPEFNIPAKTTAAGEDPLPGVLVTQQAAVTPSTGTGTGGGGGTGTGGGIGPGTGSGLGPGSGGGTGGGVYRVGSGVSSPIVVFEKRPAYTADAMRARIQGAAWVAAIVMPDGSVGGAHIVRSLDSTFGLDEEAIKAVKQWRFQPGTRLGKPVPVEIVVEVTFTMR